MGIVKKNELTPKQFGVLKYWYKYWCAHGYPPTLREIAAAMSASSCFAAACQMRYITRKGHLAKSSGNLARGYELRCLPIFDGSGEIVGFTTPWQFDQDAIRKQASALKLQAARQRHCGLQSEANAAYLEAAERELAAMDPEEELSTRIEACGLYLEAGRTALAYEQLELLIPLLQRPTKIANEKTSIYLLRAFIEDSGRFKELLRALA